MPTTVPVTGLVLDRDRDGVTRARVPSNVFDGTLHEVCPIGNSRREPDSDEAEYELTGAQLREFLPGRVAYAEFD